MSASVVLGGSRHGWRDMQVFECLRKLALTGLMVFFMPGTPPQVCLHTTQAHR